MKGVSNLYLKIISFLLGITLWVYVQGRETVETSIKMNLFLTDVSENLYLDEISTGEITVWIRGTKPHINQLLKKTKKIEISLKNFPEGKHSITITPLVLNLPKTVEIVRIQPEKVTFKLLGQGQKKVPIRPEYTGKRHIVLSPPSVFVKGDRRLVDKVEYIYTEPFLDDGKKKEILVKLILPSERLKLSTDVVKVIFK